MGKVKQFNLTPTTALRPCTGVFTRTMGMPCAHTIQPILADGDSLEPEYFKWQLYLEHGDLEPVDYRLWVQNPERIQPRGRPCPKGQEVQTVSHGGRERNTNKVDWDGTLYVQQMSARHKGEGVPKLNKILIARAINKAAAEMLNSL
ncbi:hypothetical protein V1506DRAFT_281571 [Lipomyces tetrasporus]